MGGRWTGAALALLLSATNGAAVAPRLDTEPPAVEPARPQLMRLPAETLAPRAVKLGAAQQRFVAEHPGWSLEQDTLSGRPRRAHGPGLPFVASAAQGGPSGEARRAALQTAAREFLATRAELFELPAEQLFELPAESVSIADGALDVVRLGLRREGLPVMGARLTLAARHGRLVFFHSSHADAELPLGARHQLGAAQALERALTHAGAAAAGLTPEAPALKLWLPSLDADAGYRLEPIWRLVLASADGQHRWDAWVHAASGAVLGFSDLVRAACANPAPQPLARATGGVRPALATDPEQRRPLAGLSVEPWGMVSDAAGLYAPGEGDGASRLEGEHAQVVCVACSDPVEPYATSGLHGGIDFGFNGPQDGDADGNGLSTLAGRTVYAQLAGAAQLGRSWLDGLSFLDRSFEVDVNWTSACNALYTGFALRFYRGDAECRNTGEIRDIILHEWGHALDDFDGTPLVDPGYGEGVADVLAMLVDHDSCIAESIYRQPSAPPPSNGCGGVRDLDARAPGLQHSPAVLRLDDNDCEGQPHCLGEIYGQTAWHLAQSLVSGRSYADGSQLGEPQGELNGWRISEQLLMLARPLAEVMDPQAAAVSVYDATVVAGTHASGRIPWLDWINDAFDHHGLAPSPPVSDSLGCQTLNDPSGLTLSADIDGEGRDRVQLSFEGQASERFRVLRRSQDEAIFRPLAGEPQDLGAGLLGLEDHELLPGMSYEYAVQRLNQDDCASPGVKRASILVANPELVPAELQIADPHPVGNGDGNIDPGEYIAIDLAVAELSGRTGADLALGQLESLDPQVQVIAALPVEYASVPAGGSAASDNPFLIHVDPQRDCRAPIPLRVGFETPEGCRWSRLELPMGPDACPDGQRPELLVTGLEVVDDALGSCSDGDLQPDAGERVALRVGVLNRGDAAASAFDIKLSSSHPELAFLNGGLTHVDQVLDPGQELSGELEAVLGELGCGEQVAIEAFAQAPESAPSPIEAFTLDTEVDLSASELRFDFETGLQGWQASGGWTPSDSRSFPDDSGWSLWSGSADNQCDRLSSPELTLHPVLPSTLSIQTWYQFFRLFQGKWWDGANVYVLSQQGETLLEPVAGRGYDATLYDNLGCEAGQPAWTSDRAGLVWAESRFDLTPWAGQTIRIQLRVGTDNRNLGEGLYLDDVRVSNVSVAGCDDYECSAPPDCAVPNAWIVGPTSACVDQQVELRASGDYWGSGSFEHDWDLGDGSVVLDADRDAPVRHVYANPNDYQVVFRSVRRDDPSCFHTASHPISVGVAPAADAGPDVEAPSPIGTPGSLVGFSYSWSPSDGLDNPDVPRPLANPQQTTEYCVTVTPVSGGCSASDCVLVSVPNGCGLDPEAVSGFAITKQGDDLHYAWLPIPEAGGGYGVLSVEQKSRLASIAAANSGAVEVAAAGDAGDASASEPDGRLRAPGLRYYQVLARCP